jgi:hypothetical protein
MIRRLGAFLRGFGRDDRGVAAVETALVGSIFLVSLFNVIEVGRYAYTAMQVTAASQAGAQAAIVNCEPEETPVTTKCPGVTAAIQVAAQSGSLGNDVTLDGPIEEAWYCVTSQKTLQSVGSVGGTPPSDCDDVSLPSGSPALYVRVRVVAEFEPLFPGLTFVQTFPESIQRTGWMRVL